jgi:hypothetical protein
MTSYKYLVKRPFMARFKDEVKTRACQVGEVVQFHESTESDTITGLVWFGKLIPSDFPPTFDCLVICSTGITMPVGQKMEVAKRDEIITLTREVAAPLIATGQVRPVGTYWQPGRLKRTPLPDRSATYGVPDDPPKNFVIDYQGKVKRP